MFLHVYLEAKKKKKVGDIPWMPDCSFEFGLKRLGLRL